MDEVAITSILEATILVPVVFATFLVGSAAAVSKFKSFTVPPGEHTLQFNTGAHPPLHNLHFIMGGNPDVTIKSIVGTNNGSPDITFDPPAKPFEVTIILAQNPIPISDSSDFVIKVTNPLNARQSLEIGVVFNWRGCLVHETDRQN